MLLSAAIWLQNTGLMRALRESDRGYETLLALHVSCIALFAAMILLTGSAAARSRAARLFRFRYRRSTTRAETDRLSVRRHLRLSDVWHEGRRILPQHLFSDQGSACSPWSRCMRSYSVRASIIARGFGRRRAEPPLRAKVAAALSLLLWFGIVCAGRGIGYIHPPPFSHHFTEARRMQSPPSDRPGVASALTLRSDSLRSQQER